MKRATMVAMLCLALAALLLPISACSSGGSGTTYMTVHHGYGYGPGWGTYGGWGRSYYPPGGVVVGPPVIITDIPVAVPY